MLTTKKSAHTTEQTLRMLLCDSLASSTLNGGMSVPPVYRGDLGNPAGLWRADFRREKEISKTADWHFSNSWKTSKRRAVGRKTSHFYR